MKVKVSFKVSFETSDTRVICTVVPTIVDNELEKMIKIYQDLFNKSVPIPREAFYGICNRQDGDENDIELAKKIAKKKAMRRAYREIRNYNMLIFNKIDTELQNYRLYINSAHIKAATINEEIKELVK